MKEDFLHFVWRLRRFRLNQLQTTVGEAVELIDPGRLNTDAGPDFLDARIRIGGTLWAGNVEMHLRSSEWYAHQHHKDPKYDNVILHVVLDEDKPVFHSDGGKIPCLNLRQYLPLGLAKQYLRLLHSEQWIPCQNLLHEVPEINKSLWFDRLLIERLEERTTVLRKRLIGNANDWEETFYQSLAWGFGLKVNADPFLMLAESLPLKTLLKHKHNLTQMEALLFGQAGLLEDDFSDDYPRALQNEYAFLRKKYRLTPLTATSWKFMRMRPANFPSIRLAQWATLLFRTGQLFSKMLVAQNLKEIENALIVELSNYWKTHFRFDKESKKSNKTLGKTRIHLLVINIIAPFIFLYGQERGDERYKDRALDLLEAIPGESNKIISEWNKLGVKAKQASQTQALLQLKNNYCDQKRCLDCAIGCNILKREPDLMEEDVLYLPSWWLEPVEERRRKGA